jgi:hypothetical protein
MTDDGYVMRGERKVERGKMQWNFSEKVTATLPYVGPYEMLAAQRPKRGTTLPEFPTLVVIGADLEEGDGGTGTMTVHFELPNFTEELAGNEPIADAEYEIAFNEEKAAIWVHPRCGFLHGDVVAAQKLHLDDWEGLLAFPAAYKERVAHAPEFTAPWTFAQYIALRERGVEDYLVSSPTVSRTLIYLGKPDDVGDGCFTHQNPPVDAAFEEVWKYDWLLGADVVTKTGRVWKRTTRWIGAAWRVDDAGTLFSGWDDLIYD